MKHLTLKTKLKLAEEKLERAKYLLDRTPAKTHRGESLGNSPLCSSIFGGACDCGAEEFNNRLAEFAQ